MPGLVGSMVRKQWERSRWNFQGLFFSANCRFSFVLGRGSENSQESEERMPPNFVLEGYNWYNTSTGQPQEERGNWREAG